MKIPVWKSLTIGWDIICLINKYIRYKKPESDGGVKLSDKEKTNLFGDVNKLVLNTIGDLKGSNK